MAKSMTKNVEIPAFLYTDDYNVEKIIKLRAEINKLNSNKNQKITFMPFILKAVSLSLKEYPIINSIALDNKNKDNIITHYKMRKEHNISIAIDVPEGLLVPNIKSVQTKSVFRIQKDLDELREKAKTHRFNASDLSDGTFSVSNIGNIGGKGLAPCIMPPQVAILAVSKIYDSVHIVTKEEAEQGNYENILKFESGNTQNYGVAYYKVMNMCISADHRIVDGATVARFSELLRSYVENPLKILSNE